MESLQSIMEVSIVTDNYLLKVVLEIFGLVGDQMS
jgi:hypothetical protein